MKVISSISKTTQLLKSYPQINLINRIKQAASLKKSFSELTNNDINNTNGIKENNNKDINNKVDYAFNTSFFLENTKTYEQKLEDVIHKYEILEQPIQGKATPSKTEFYSQRNINNVHADNFKKTFNDLTISTLGIGSYLGKPDDINDFYLYNAIKTSVLSGGINHIDTAINYRYMKSEKAIGKALQILVHKYKIAREELILSSKIGFVPENATEGKRSHYYIQELVEKNKMKFEDVIFDDLKRPVHCIHPEFLGTQLKYSLSNLNISCLDILYLHNVFEMQVVPKHLLIDRLSKAFEFCEQAREKGMIGSYGLATWNSIRTDVSNAQHCSLQMVAELARKIGGKNNGFNFVQAPINLASPEIFIEKYQEFNVNKFIRSEQKMKSTGSSNDSKDSNDSKNTINTNKEEIIDIESESFERLNTYNGATLKKGTLSENINNPFSGEEKENIYANKAMETNRLESNIKETDNNDDDKNDKKIFTTATAICYAYKLNLISSAPLLQGSILNVPLENKIGLRYNASKHLQLIRSIPAECLKSTLCGMKSQIHVKNNLEVLKVPRLTSKEFYQLLAPKKRSPYIEKEVL